MKETVESWCEFLLTLSNGHSRAGKRKRHWLRQKSIERSVTNEPTMPRTESQLDCEKGI